MSEDELRKWLRKIIRLIRRLRAQARKTEAAATREPVYDVKGAAIRLKLRPYTVRQMCNKGELAAEKVDGAGGQGEWRITEEEIQRYLRDGKRRPPRKAG